MAYPFQPGKSFHYRHKANLAQSMRDKLSEHYARKYYPVNVRKRYRKRYGKKKRKGGELCTIRSLQQPDRLRVKLLVVDAADDISGTVANVVRLYAGNSAFDPLDAFGSAQPTGFDQYAGLFNRYKILGSSISVRATVTATLGAPLIIGLLALPNSTAPSTMNVFRSQKNAKIAFLKADTSAHTQLRQYQSTNLIFQTHADDLDLSGVVTANPALRWFWHLRVETIGGATDIDCFLFIKMIYYVEFFSPKIVLDA